MYTTAVCVFIRVIWSSWLHSCSSLMGSLLTHLFIKYGHTQIFCLKSNLINCSSSEYLHILSYRINCCAFIHSISFSCQWISLACPWVSLHTVNLCLLSSWVWYNNFSDSSKHCDYINFPFIFVSASTYHLVTLFLNFLTWKLLVNFNFIRYSWITVLAALQMLQYYSCFSFSIYWFILSGCHNNQHWARPKPGTKDFICFSHVSGWGTNTWVGYFPLLFPVH